MTEILNEHIDELKQLCKLLKIKRMYAFGSVVSDNLSNDSDIDFLISFIDGLSVEEYTENYFSLYYKLRDIFNRNIDLVTERNLSNPYFIESVNESKELIYES